MRGDSVHGDSLSRRVTVYMGIVSLGGVTVYMGIVSLKGMTAYMGIVSVGGAGIATTICCRIE